MRSPAGMVERTSAGSWAGFVSWAVVGAAASSGLLIFGALALIPIVLAAWLVAVRPPLRRSGFGALTGIGATLLFVAYVQRRGPGTTCWHTATASGCDQYLNPWPWLVAGIALAVAGFIAHVRRARRET